MVGKLPPQTAHRAHIVTLGNIGKELHSGLKKLHYTALLQCSAALPWLTRPTCRIFSSSFECFWRKKRMLQKCYEFNLSYFGLLPGRLPRLVSTYPLIIFSLVIDKGLEGSMNWCSLCNSECRSSAIETFIKISNSPPPPSSLFPP